MEEAVTPELGWPWALVALGACVAVIACAIWRRREIKPAAFIWAVPFAAIPAFFAVWCASGLCQTEPAPFCESQLLCALLGIAVLHRDKIAQAVLRQKHDGNHTSSSQLFDKALPWIRDLALIMIAAWFSFAALEMADNPDWVSIEAGFRVREVLILGVAIASLYFIGQRRGVLCVVVPVVCALFGLVQNFLDLFKNTALLPSDVLAWQTAATVSGGYTYVLPTLAIESIVSAAVAIAALSLIMPVQACTTSQRARRTIPQRAGRVALNLALGALCAFGVWASVDFIDYQETFGVKLDYWDLRNSYHKYGFFASFVAATQALSVDEPEGYSDEAALEVQTKLAQQYDEQFGAARKSASAQFGAKKPSVIAIMNESYSDLSIFDELHDGYTGTYVTQTLADCAVKGYSAMSVHGGGTCNSEYEFLAFSSMSFMGAGMYPYQLFSFANAYTLPSVFKQLGYSTWGMHPSYPGNWNREFVYADMGIDQSLFVYDFEGADEFHGQVSDRATYERTLDILKGSDDAQFILNITMQNHSGYDRNNIPADQIVQVHPDFLDADETAVLDEFLSCIQSSDEALEYLIDELSKLDEPVAVVFFGDHQPSMTRTYNDILFSDEADLVHKTRISLTPYFIWTNYDVETPGAAAGDAGGTDEAGGNSEAGSAGGVDGTGGTNGVSEASGTDEADGASEADINTNTLSSANYLGAQLLETIGAPLDDYTKALLVLHQQIIAVNTNGFCDSQGIWHNQEDGADFDHPYHQLQMIHYLNVVRNL